jgi:hypothetical protein
VTKCNLFCLHFIKPTGAINAPFKQSMSLVPARGGHYGNVPVRRSSMGKIAAFYHACVSACEAGAGTTIFHQDITLIALCSTDRLFEL